MINFLVDRTLVIVNFGLELLSGNRRLYLNPVIFSHVLFTWTMGKIFISYNRQSESITKTLAQDIEELGYTVWFDHEISGGQVWWDQILMKIRDCDIFVFVTDQHSLDSTACKREYGYAAELGKTILPILVSGEVSVNLLPPELSRIQFVDYRTYDTKAALRLARAMAGIPPSRPLPDPLPAPPEIPISYLGNLHGQIESTSTLNYADQSTLLVEIKRSFREPSTTKDARKLLEIFRKRPDLFATIADEIDELLDKSKKEASNPDKPDVVEKNEYVKKNQPDKKEQALSLDQIIVGTWTVQISQLFTGTISATFIFSPNGTFSGQLFSNMGTIPVQGQWSVNMQMLYLNGFQTLAFMNYPYSAEITFMVVLQNHLEGTSQAGENIIMQR
jgi:hypothetical protein